MKRQVIIIWILLFAAFVSRSQSPLEKRIDFAVENSPLLEALEELILHAGVNLNFSSKAIPPNARVTYRGKGVRVAEVLDALVEGQLLVYSIIGEQIVLSTTSSAITPRFKTISGYVLDSESGEQIIGALVYDPSQEWGGTTNEFGFFSLRLPTERSKLVSSYLGYTPDTFLLDRAGRADFIEIKLAPLYLKEVVIKDFTDTILLMSNGPGDLLLNMTQITRLAALGGESDALRAAYSLPGIVTGADGFGGVSVRGGNVDQNLYLLDDVPVYNSTHGIGVFSIFNTSAIKSMRLLKGNFPAQYGGRLSSVWDVRTKDGNSNEFQGETEAGITSGKLTLEGPFNNRKGSFLFSARRAFFDFYSVPITRQIRKEEGVDGYLSYLFYDLNLKVNHQLGQDDRLYFSAYRGKDDYEDIYRQKRTFQDTSVFLGDEEMVNWGNDLASLRWSHRLGHKAFLNVAAVYSRYFYQSIDLVDLLVKSESNLSLRNVLLLKYDSEISDRGARLAIDLTPAPHHQLKSGLELTQHRFQPGILFFDNAVRIDSIEFDTLGEWNKTPMKTIEVAAFAQDEIKLGHRFFLNLGLRMGFLHAEGNQFVSWQPRLAMKYQLNRKNHLRFSIGRNTQFIHLLSPTSVGLPKDLWVSATALAPPEHSWQFTAGMQHKLLPAWNLEVELYYKDLTDLILFKGNFLEDVNAVNWQDDISIGSGKAYGMELLLKKEAGKTLGWFGYSLAWTNRVFDKEINKGEAFPFRLDRRHSLDLQLLHKLNRTWELSAAIKFASGTAFTLPIQEYELVQPPGSPPTEIVVNPRVVDKLNGERLPAYHKLDISANKIFGLKHFQHTLTVGLSNVYNRRNPLYITIRDRFLPDGEIKREFVKVSLIPLFPSLRYRLRFK